PSLISAETDAVNQVRAAWCRASIRKRPMTTRREFLGSVPAAGAALAVSGRFLLEGADAHAQAAAPPAGHFHPKGKAPSTFTLDALRQARATLPFSDTRDFDEQKRGLIAPMTE